MAEIEHLLQRIDAEFAALENRIQQARAEKVQEHQERQKRLAVFEKLLAELPEVWQPRLEALTKKFGDKVRVTPKVTSTCREGTFNFDSNLARIRLRLSASTDHDARKLVLDYHLEILPILMKFDSHQQAEWPLDAVDRQAIANWIDDRLVDFVKTYLALHQNEYYLKDHMVEDPIAGIRFPKLAAATKLERDGKTYYFIGEETRREFEARQGSGAK
jgi:YHS domain-containing protein